MAAKGTTLPFDRTLALEDQTFVGLAETADQRALYDEYVRSLDDVPTLTDLVSAPRLPPDFRLGERKDARRAPREDSDAIREARMRELAALYDEYLDPERARARGKWAKASAAVERKSTNSKTKRRRKRKK